MNNNFFRVIDSEEKAYWLGFLTADGSVWRKKGKAGGVEVRLAIRDFGHLRKLKHALGSDRKICRAIPKGGYSAGKPNCHFSVCSIELAKDLAAYGVVPCKTGRTVAPRFPEQVSWELAKHYWRGLVDGDGSICETYDTKGNWLPSLALCGDQVLLEEFKAFCLRNSTTRANVCQGTRIWAFKVGCRPALDLILLLYGDSQVHLDRKKQKAMKLLNRLK